MRVLAPGTVGNVGPGFDVLGLAVEGLHDVVEVDLVDGPDAVEVTGRDAAEVPRDPARNAASIAARAMLDHLGVRRGARVRIEKGLPVSGGLGGSAASSVGGALAAGLSAGARPSPVEVMEAALAGEAAVAGRHLDNVGPCVLGGLCLVRSGDPIDVVRVPVAARWWLALLTPSVRLETRRARAVLPERSERSEWVAQMAHTAALVLAFATGDEALARRALHDGFAEPRRAPLVPRFGEIRGAALEAGALGGSLSGAGPSVFALAADEARARACARAMREASDPGATVHVGPVDLAGARAA